MVKAFLQKGVYDANMAVQVEGRGSSVNVYPVKVDSLGFCSQFHHKLRTGNRDQRTGQFEDNQQNRAVTVIYAKSKPKKISGDFIC